MIPVANPPPEEPPIQTVPVSMPGSVRPRAPMGLTPVARGCLMVLAFGVFLTCVGGSVVAYSCADVMAAGTSQMLRNVEAGYRASAVRAGEESSYDSDLRQLHAIDAEGHLSLLTFGILNNRYEEARADGIVDTEELHHGMELIHDIVIGNGSVDIERYPQGR